MSEKLQPIGTIKILGEEYDVARNGNFHLVKSAGVDAYDRPVAHVVSLQNILLPSGGQYSGEVLTRAAKGARFMQALLDALGESMVRLQGQRDLRRGEAE